MNTRISPRTLLLTIFGLVIFPALILLPYLIHATGRIFVVAAYPPLEGCVANGSITLVNQCTAWDEPQVLKLITLVGLAVIISWGALSLMNARSTRHLNKKGAVILLLLNLAVMAVTLSAYSLMRSDSEAGIRAASLPAQGDWVTSDPPVFGYGLNPYMVILLSAIYILVPLMVWYRINISPARIGGVKKKELFQ